MHVHYSRCVYFQVYRYLYEKLFYLAVDHHRLIVHGAFYFQAVV